MPLLPGANGTAEVLNSGSVNDNAEGVFRKHFNPAIKSFEPGWNALIGAISAGDQTNFNNGRYAIDQLWIHSSSGLYLERRASDVGVTKPESVGISDEIFRKLTIKTTTKKVVTQALLEVMEVFYGTDSTRANMTAIDGPYALEDGWELFLKIDGGSLITVPFTAADFTDINVATTVEVAAVITRWLNLNNSTAYALAHINPITGNSTVKLYSGALGLRSTIQCFGGQAQNVLQFPTLLTQAISGEQWIIQNSTTVGVAPGKTRFKRTTPTTTDLNLVVVGDYVNIFGASIDPANLGTFVITDVDVRYVSSVLTQFFEVELEGSVPETPTMLSDFDIVFFHPKKNGINDNGARAVVVAQNSAGVVNVQLPATTIAVSRTAKTGAYANTNDAIYISTIERGVGGSTTITTATPHELTVNGQVILDYLEPGGTVAPINPGNGTTTTDASLNTTSSTIAAPGFGAAAGDVKSLLLANGDVFMCGGLDSLGPPNPIAYSQRLSIGSPSTLANGSIRYTYTWLATADMPALTTKHAISLLTDSSQPGNVLASGGTDLGSVYSTSYIYNVTGNIWSVNIPMITGRYSHSQVVLDDGNVLACGGYEDLFGTSSFTAEIFSSNTTAGAWRSVDPMSVDRARFPGVKLSNGKVLVPGGMSFLAGRAVNSCELYDPATETWAATGPMGYARLDHLAVLLPDGRVFVWGGKGHIVGQTTLDIPLTTSEIYDPNTGRWYPAAPNSQRSPVFADDVDSMAYLASKNQIIVTGRGLPRIDIYDVATGCWLPSTGSLDTTSDPVEWTSLVALDSYPIVVQAGGFDSGLAPTSARLYVSAIDTVDGGGLNDIVFEVTSVVSATEFEIVTPNNLQFFDTNRGDPIVTGFYQAAAPANIPGPYIYSPDEGVAITDISTTIDAPMTAKTKYRHVLVDSALDFPDEEGWLVFGFGTAIQTGPIKYLGRESTGYLLIDYSSKFHYDLPLGTSVILLDHKGPFVPDNPEELGSLYITDSSSGRVAASETLDDLMAAGLTLHKTIVYPGDTGLGGAGYPATGQKLSDKVEVWAGNSIDAEMEDNRGSE